MEIGGVLYDVHVFHCLALVICPFYFHNYISVMVFTCVFLDMLCSTPRVSTLHFCNILRDLLTFYSLIARFCYIFFVNFLSTNDVS
jgi:hypothetical protein